MLRLIRFALVGGTAALVHLLVFSALIYSTRISPMVVNVVAFLLAFGVSYIGQSRFTFADKSRRQGNVARYFLTSCLGFFINETTLGVGLFFGLKPIVAVCIAILLAALVTYLVSKKWVFI